MPRAYGTLLWKGSVSSDTCPVLVVPWYVYFYVLNLKSQDQKTTDLD